CEERSPYVITARCIVLGVRGELHMTCYPELAPHIHYESLILPNSGPRPLILLKFVKFFFRFSYKVLILERVELWLSSDVTPSAWGEVLRLEHPDTLTSAYHLAFLVHRQQRYRAALEWYQRAYNGHVKALGAQHPTTAVCFNHFESAVKVYNDLAAVT